VVGLRLICPFKNPFQKLEKKSGSFLNAPHLLLSKKGRDERFFSQKMVRRAFSKRQTYSFMGKRTLFL